MERLPKVFANPIKHDINNTQKSFRSSDNNGIINNTITTYDIDRILNSNTHIFRSKVKLLINNTYQERIIVSRNNDYLITIDNEKIPIKDIKSIEKI